MNIRERKLVRKHRELQKRVKRRKKLLIFKPKKPNLNMSLYRILQNRL